MGMHKKHKKKVLTAREKYRAIKPVPCPAFNGDKIYFTKIGFNHLIRKGRFLRPNSEQKERLDLIILAPQILKENNTFQTHQIREKDLITKSDAQFWSFTKIIDGDVITIIVRQLDDKPKHFFSIFKNKPT